MRFRYALICCAALTLVYSTQNDASAGIRSRSNRSATSTTILPSRAEVSAVPVPEQGRVLAYPVDVVRYGANVSPTSRIVRGFIGR